MSGYRGVRRTCAVRMNALSWVFKAPTAETVGGLRESEWATPAKTLRESIIPQRPRQKSTLAASCGVFLSPTATQTRHGGPVVKYQPCSQIMLRLAWSPSWAVTPTQEFDSPPHPIWQKSAIGPMAVCKRSPIRESDQERETSTCGGSDQGKATGMLR